ncbi:BPI fold-containing family A member 1 [Microtus ochrogaster]|uniref:BPI fold-containing family A member 1 n=1 Tax=Microtus ochrogaster TaxID=79684 RepID=A0A8J6GEY1_MICOH|nr:BPI fold-containing family A member 1 [Microtus ochrogaster]
MLLVGSLFVLFGLLAQSSAQLAGLPLPLGQGLPLPQDQRLSLPLNQGLPSDPTGHLAGSFTDALSGGLLSGGLLGNLENIPLLDIIKSGGGTSYGLVGGLLGTLTSSIPFLNNILEPLVGNLLELAVKLNITSEVLAVKNNQGRVHLVLGDCTHSPGSLQIILLDGSTPLQSFLDSLTVILTKVLPDLVQGKVCPLVNAVLSHLDVTMVHDIAVLDLPGAQEFSICSELPEWRTLTAVV